MIHVPSLIEKKRDGTPWSAHEIDAFIKGFVAGEIPDYQASAWAMAVFFRGMTAEETFHLTRAMLQSGGTVAHPADAPPRVDKHSTGGVGDKVSLVLAPLLACANLWVPMISGRGLGITGGTLDKLESIPGFNVALDLEQAAAQLKRIGVFMIGQTDELCPADRKLYALRDVTGTVPSLPLIVSSIMSKKLAENLDRLILDVKFGSGAFMKDRAAAESLAGALAEVGARFGVETFVALNRMDEPTGTCVGNALEVAEAVVTLQGAGPPDLVDLTLNLAEKVARAPRTDLARWLENGAAWRKFVELVEAQGGDARALERITQVHPSRIEHRLVAATAGRITKVDAGTIGRASLALGAGRGRATDAIDYAVGCSHIKKIGTQIGVGETLLHIHARDETTLRASLPLFTSAIEISPI